MKKLLASDDPDAQAEASAVATANAAASTTEFVVAQATGSDGETSERPDTDWESASLVVDAMPQDDAGDASDVSTQGDAMAIPVDPLLSPHFGLTDGLSSVLRDDANHGDVDAVSTADADAAMEAEVMEAEVLEADAEGFADLGAEGLLVDGTEPVNGADASDDDASDTDTDASDAELSSDARSDATVFDAVSNADVQPAETHAAETKTPLDDRGNANQRERAEKAHLPDEFASSKDDQANSQAGAVPSQVDRVGNATAEAGNGERQDDRWESAKLADDAAAIFGTAEGLQVQAVVGADSVDGVEGLSESSGPVSGVATLQQAAESPGVAESPESAESNSRVADRFDSEVTSNERDRANDVDAAADDTVTEQLAGQNAQPQIASGLASDSAGETAHENAPAMGAIQPVSKESADDSESLDSQDAGELFVDSEVLESVSIDTQSQTELDGQPSSRGDSFDAMVSGEPIDVTPDLSEQPSVVPIESPFNAAAEMVVDQEILETLSLEEFISQSPASPEAVKKSAEVISDAMRSSLQLEGQTVRVEIHPAELGTLKIQVTQSDQAIETQIIATEFVTSELLTSHRDQLMEALSDLGFETSDINISYDDQSSTESDGRQPTAEHRYQSKPETTQTQGSRASVSGGGVNIVA
ncbi:flagellar hook-length control protein FliK [Stieleria magnilauensis]|uniref:flagellar hook-length control protein FliK n=1 Tax=Stieleria magnilauensis TaxID=2527963 RepID=UPI003AF4C661